MGYSRTRLWIYFQIRKLKRVLRFLPLLIFDSLKKKEKPVARGGAFIDRRDSPRVETRNLLQVHAINDNATHHVVNLIDLSTGGFQFAGMGELCPGTTLNVVVNIRELDECIPMSVKVVWSHPLKNERPRYKLYQMRRTTYHTGVSIIAVDGEGHELLDHFVNAKLSSDPTSTDQAA